jgi:tryptophanyl-tRNA synthetase
MSLADPSKKMSKSAPNERSRISLSDSSEVIREKIRRAVTDSDGDSITFEEKRPGLANLLRIYGAFTDR